MIENTIANLINYIKKTLAVSITTKEWNAALRLPLIIREHYSFYATELLGSRVLLMHSTSEEPPTPAVVRKHMDLIRLKSERETVFVCPALTAYNRQRFIEQKVPFVIPDNQLYLPFLGIALQEYFKKHRLPSAQQASPATQVVLLTALYDTKEKLHSAQSLARRLGYSTMTISRAFDEIQTAGIAEISKNGRERLLSVNDNRKDIWEKAKEFLTTPVKRRVFCRAKSMKPGGLKAGLSALAHYGGLTEPFYTIKALDEASWKRLTRTRTLVLLPAPEQDSVEIEIWSYNPGIFSRAGFVDRLSLALSLQHEKDERIEAAIEKMLKEHEW